MLNTNINLNERVFPQLPRLAFDIQYNKGQNKIREKEGERKVRNKSRESERKRSRARARGERSSGGRGGGRESPVPGNCDVRSL